MLQGCSRNRISSSCPSQGWTPFKTEEDNPKEHPSSEGRKESRGEYGPRAPLSARTGRTLGTYNSPASTPLPPLIYNSVFTTSSHSTLQTFKQAPPNKTTKPTNFNQQTCTAPIAPSVVPAATAPRAARLAERYVTPHHMSLILAFHSAPNRYLRITNADHCLQSCPN
jgi:hypothetical protein